MTILRINLTRAPAFRRKENEPEQTLIMYNYNVHLLIIYKDIYRKK